MNAQKNSDTHCKNNEIPSANANLCELNAENSSSATPTSTLAEQRDSFPAKEKVKASIPEKEKAKASIPAKEKAKTSSEIIPIYIDGEKVYGKKSKTPETTTQTINLAEDAFSSNEKSVKSPYENITEEQNSQTKANDTFDSQCPCHKEKGVAKAKKVIIAIMILFIVVAVVAAFLGITKSFFNKDVPQSDETEFSSLISEV